MLKNVLTVSALNRLARETLEQRFALLWVCGEICNLSRAASGHVYFSLKDETAQARCVMFRARAQLLPWRLENGQQVEAQVLVTLYEARGEYQLVVEALSRSGLGALYEAYARLRAKLEQEGLFAADRKRPLPRFPRRVGIVTSRHAAALHDVISVIRRRARHLSLLLYESPVQGEGAGARLAAAVARAGARRSADGIDVLLLVRGGGSLEDLFAFNDEGLARAIAASPIPVVTGVGHETDTTIADLAADQRAPTPSAAAELVTGGWFAAALELDVLKQRLRAALRSHIDARAQSIDVLDHRLVHPGARLARGRETLQHLSVRLHRGAAASMSAHAMALRMAQLRWLAARPDVASLRADVEALAQRLHAGMRALLLQRTGRLNAIAAGLAQLSPQATLERGYAIVVTEAGNIVRTSAAIAPGDDIRLRFAVGRARARITDTN